MKSYIVYPDGKCRIEEMPMPVIDEYSALAKMESCGVCNGTDSKIIHGTFKGIDGYPVVLGHEGVGRIVELGRRVRNYKVGDLVLMPYWSDVPEGYYSAWGTYSEYNVVTDAQAMQDDGRIPDEFSWGQNILPSSFDPVSSAMIITFREVLSTMKTFGFEANKSIAVLGLGPVGLSFVQLARLTGMGPIIAMDLSDEKLELARQRGADTVINAAKENITDAVHAICPEGVDFALDAVGVTDFINTGLSIIKPGAKVCVYGISAKTSAPLDWSTCPYNWTLQFNQFPSKIAESQAHNQIVRWIQLGLINPADYISHVFDFADIDQAFEKIERREPMMKMVIKF